MHETGLLGFGMLSNLAYYRSAREEDPGGIITRHWIDILFLHSRPKERI